MSPEPLAFYPQSAASTLRFVADSLVPDNFDFSIYSSVAVFVDEKVPSKFYEPILNRCSADGVPCKHTALTAGESLKELEGCSRILDEMAEAGLDRSSLIVAIGGGSLGDAVGFAASIWNRGIPWIAVPTTLLAMVDAHLGGKTALHHGRIKNRIGSFHLPREVWVNPDVLLTLPVRELRQGWAEMIKAALIGGEPFFSSLENGIPENLLPPEDLIRRAMEVKVSIVNSDLKESGRRKVLNLGHTLAHALEMERTDQDPRWAHGEAVSIGLVFACSMAENLGFAEVPLSEKVSTLLESSGLPVRIEDPPEADVLLDRIEQDKKSRGGRVSWILPERPGSMLIRELSREEVREHLTDWIQKG